MPVHWCLIILLSGGLCCCCRRRIMQQHLQQPQRFRPQASTTQPIPMLGVWELWMRRAGVWVWCVSKAGGQRAQTSCWIPLLLLWLADRRAVSVCRRSVSRAGRRAAATTRRHPLLFVCRVLLTHPPTHKHSHTHTHRNHGERLNIDTRGNAFAAPSRGIGRFFDRLCLCCAWAAANNASSSFAYVAYVVVQSIDRSIGRFDRSTHPLTPAQHCHHLYLHNRRPRFGIVTAACRAGRALGRWGQCLQDQGRRRCGRGRSKEGAERGMQGQGARGKPARHYSLLVLLEMMNAWEAMCLSIPSSTRPSMHTVRARRHDGPGAASLPQGAGGKGQEGAHAGGDGGAGSRVGAGRGEQKGPPPELLQERGWVRK